MVDIKYCSVTFPQFNEEVRFDAVYQVSDCLYVWVNYDKTKEQSSQLFSFLASNGNFTVQIITENQVEMTGFDCICLTPFFDTIHCSQNRLTRTYEPPYEKDLIRVKSNLWIEGAVSSIDSLVWHTLRFDIPYAEPWFNEKTKEFEIDYLGSKYTICFFNDTKEIFQRLPKSYTKKQNCKIYVYSNNALSTKCVIEHATMLQTLIRYMSDISYPLLEISVSNEKLPNRYFISIKGKIGLKGIEDKPETKDYIDMPLKLSNLNYDNLIKWIYFWNKISFPIIMVDLARGKPLDIQMVEYVKTFDTLSSQFLSVSLLTNSNVEFKKWRKEVVKIIETNNPFGFTSDRISNLISSLQYPDLSYRMTSFLKEQRLKEIKQEEDVSQIAKYLKKLRVSDAHPSNFDIFDNLPKGYSIFDMYTIAKQMVRRLIDKEILLLQ